MPFSALPEAVCFTSSGMSLQNEVRTVTEMAKKVDDNLILVFGEGGDLKERVRSVRNQFNLWKSVNGIFDQSFIERLSASDNHSFLELFTTRMRRILSCLGSNTGTMSTTSKSDALEEIHAVVRSLHRLGEAMRTELPHHHLARRIRNAVNRVHGNAADLLMLSDVVEEIKQLRMGLKNDEVERYAGRIYRTYRLVFATLLLIYKPGRIFGFLENGIDDEALPIKEADLVERHKPQGWMPDDAAQFVHFQHLLIDRLYELKLVSPTENELSEVTERELAADQSVTIPPMRTGVAHERRTLLNTPPVHLPPLSVAMASGRMRGQSPLRSQRPSTYGLPTISESSASSVPALLYGRTDSISSGRSLSSIAYDSGNWEFVNQSTIKKEHSLDWSMGVVVQGDASRIPTVVHGHFALEYYLEEQDRMEMIRLGKRSRPQSDSQPGDDQELVPDIEYIMKELLKKFTQG